MKLTRLRLEQFRQFRQPLEIAGLEPGLNVFTGPNEAGKSTLVAAIRAAFFERHRSKRVDDLQPWGDTSAAPTVELDFTLAGTPCHLVKRFLNRPRCDLRIGDRQLDGADAEDYLAEQLGFQFAGRGASTEEHWGIPGLLWISQGSTQLIAKPVEHAADHLNRVLGDALGEVASSRGDAILARVEAARNELLTPATGKPRNAYADAEARIAALETRLGELDSAIATYRRQVDSLAELRREHAADSAEKPWLAQRAAAQAATDKLAAIAGLERDLADTRRHAEQLDERARLLRQQLDAFAQQEDDARRRDSEAQTAATRRADAHQQHAHWQAQHAEAVQGEEAARQHLRLARLADTRQRLGDELANLQRQAADLTERLRDAEAAHAAQRSAQAQAAATRLADADLTTLRSQRQQLDEIRIRQSAAATRIQFALDEGRTIQLGDEMLAGSGARELLAATAITLPGLGQLVVTPGGTDLTELARRGAELADAHAALCLRLGVASLDAAEARQHSARQLDFELKAASARLKDLAPRGLDALTEARDALLARADAATRRLAELPAELPAEAAAAAPLSILEAEAAEDAARRAVDTLARQLAQAAGDAANTDAVDAAARREAAAARAVVNAPERAAKLAHAQAELTDAQAARATLASRLDALTRQIDAAHPDVLKQDVERLTRSAEVLEARHAERRDRLLSLDVQLQAVGAQGLDEQRAEAERDLAQARRRHTELARRAAALDYLLGLLQSRRQALTRRLQAPLQRHLAHYLRLLFPGGRLELDEALRPAALVRPSAEISAADERGDFDALSFGAREQMGIISRLAYADLLQDAGRPTLLILDDALVHSDAERLAKMKRILFDAARRHQILLFSCHPEDWRDVGVAPRALAALRG